MCRKKDNALQFFLVHPGGPFYATKDKGVWSIPKGLPNEGEELLSTAQREFQEETGLVAKPPFHELGYIRQKGGKIVHAWAFAGEWDPNNGIRSNTFKIEWPPQSGEFRDFPEQDRAEWMTIEMARESINPAQIQFLERALELEKVLITGS